MFENFGFRDVWYVSKRFMLLIVLVLFFSTGLGAVYGYKQGTSVPEAKPKHDSYQVYMTFEVSVGGERNQSIVNIAAPFITLIQTQPAVDNISNNIKSKYTDEELNKILQLNSDHQVQPMDILKDVQIKQLLDSPAFAIIISTNDKQLSLDIANAYKSYTADVLPKEINGASVGFVDMTLNTIKAGEKISSFNKNIYIKEAETTSVAEIKQPGRKTIIMRNGILFGAFGAAGVLVFVIVFALFNPTLNRKSDFAKYDVPVISELGKIGYMRSK